MWRNYDTKKIVDLRSRKILIWSHSFNRILIFKSQITELFKPGSQLENVQIYRYCFSNFTIINFLLFTSFRDFVLHANLWKVCEIYKINVRHPGRGLDPTKRSTFSQQIDFLACMFCFPVISDQEMVPQRTAYVKCCPILVHTRA